MQERVAGWVAAYESGRREVDERLARREREIAERVRRIKASLDPPPPVPPPQARATITRLDPVFIDPTFPRRARVTTRIDPYARPERFVGSSHQPAGGVEKPGENRCARCGKYYTGGTGAACGTV